MPLYIFRCIKVECKHEETYLHGINDVEVPQCPRCGDMMERLISSGSFVMNTKGVELKK